MTWIKKTYTSIDNFKSEFKLDSLDFPIETEKNLYLLDKWSIEDSKIILWMKGYTKKDMQITNQKEYEIEIKYSKSELDTVKKLHEKWYENMGLKFLEGM